FYPLGEAEPPTQRKVTLADAVRAPDGVSQGIVGNAAGRQREGSRVQLFPSRLRRIGYPDRLTRDQGRPDVNEAERRWSFLNEGNVNRSSGLQFIDAVQRPPAKDRLPRFAAPLRRWNVIGK